MASKNLQQIKILKKFEVPTNTYVYRTQGLTPEFDEFEIRLIVPAPQEARALLHRACVHVLNTGNPLLPGNYKHIIAKDCPVQLCRINHNTLLIQPK